MPKLVRLIVRSLQDEDFEIGVRDGSADEVRVKVERGETGGKPLRAGSSIAVNLRTFILLLVFRYERNLGTPSFRSIAIGRETTKPMPNSMCTIRGWTKVRASSVRTPFPLLARALAAEQILLDQGSQYARLARIELDLADDILETDLLKWASLPVGWPAAMHRTTPVDVSPVHRTGRIGSLLTIGNGGFETLWLRLDDSVPDAPASHPGHHRRYLEGEAFTSRIVHVERDRTVELAAGDAVADAKARNHKWWNGKNYQVLDARPRRDDRELALHLVGALTKSF